MTVISPIFLPLPGVDLGSPEGIAPREAIESVLGYARSVANASMVSLVVPPDQAEVFATDTGGDRPPEMASLGEGLEVVWRGAVVHEVEAAMARGTPSMDREGKRILLPTVTGGLAVAGFSFREEEGPARLAVLQGLAAFASSSASWAAQLCDADRRAVEAETEQWTLREDCARLRELANVDDLTGLYNRRFFDRQLVQEMERFRRYRHPVSLAILDVDHFKHVNDAHGHAVGDAALCLVAAVARRSMRKADFVARIGGDELAVLMPDTPEEGALIAADRLRELVSRAPLPVEGGVVTVTLSVGVAGAEGEVDPGPDGLVKAADVALYRAKDGGRDRAVAAGDAANDSLPPGADDHSSKAPPSS